MITAATPEPTFAEFEMALQDASVVSDLPTVDATTAATDPAESAASEPGQLTLTLAQAEEQMTSAAGIALARIAKSGAEPVLGEAQAPAPVMGEPIAELHVVVEPAAEAVAATAPSGEAAVSNVIELAPRRARRSRSLARAAAVAASLLAVTTGSMFMGDELQAEITSHFSRLGSCDVVAASLNRDCAALVWLSL